MHANELRIGNWVELPSGKKIQIDRDDFNFQDGLANIEEFKPISLTEEWLVKFGFEKSDMNPKVYTYGATIKVYTDQSNYVSLFDFEYGTMEFVHEMQNFVFGIGYGELTIK